MASIADTVAALDRFSDTTGTHVVPTLQRAEELIDRARTDLQSIDDPAAREAAEQAERALDALRNVIYGWLNDYQTLTKEMRDRLREG